jgi:hypothetical protein
MGMEGINWGEVNSQAEQILNNFDNLATSFRKRLHDFEGELCQVWASGNAVKFGSDLVDAIGTVNNEIYGAYTKIGNALSKAAQTYADTFNVANEFNVSGSFSGEGNLENQFKETVNGITGMNKEVAKDSLNRFTTDTNSLIEEFNNNLRSVNIAIYDNAGAQQEAFRGALEEMMKAIGEQLQTLVGDVTTGIDTEIDNVQLAKTQTTNTFNQ